MLNKEIDFHCALRRSTPLEFLLNQCKSNNNNRYKKDNNNNNCKSSYKKQQQQQQKAVKNRNSFEVLCAHLFFLPPFCALPKENFICVYMCL